MKTNDLIYFANRKYKCRRLKIKGWGEYLVASEFLQRKLLNSNFEYYSDEAREVDEAIFFFISSIDFGLSDKKLSEKIIKSL